jgi:hypothetical protein
MRKVLADHVFEGHTLKVLRVHLPPRKIIPLRNFRLHLSIALFPLGCVGWSVKQAQVGVHCIFNVVHIDFGYGLLELAVGLRKGIGLALRHSFISAYLGLQQAKAGISLQEILEYYLLPGLQDESYLSFEDEEI